MNTERVPIIITDAEGNPRYAATATVFTDDEGMMMVDLGGVTLESNETMHICVPAYKICACSKCTTPVSEADYTYPYCDMCYANIDGVCD